MPDLVATTNEQEYWVKCVPDAIDGNGDAWFRADDRLLVVGDVLPDSPALPAVARLLAETPDLGVRLKAALQYMVDAEHPWPEDGLAVMLALRSLVIALEPTP